MRILSSHSHRKIQQGDIKEFEKVFRKFYSSLCRLAFHFTRDRDTAEEIVQDMFYNYWKKKEKIDITGSIEAYLYQAVRNRCLKWIEHIKVQNRYTKEMELQNRIIESGDHTEMETAELNHIIDETLRQLPERCREIFILNRFEGLKYREIATKLSISIKTVEANMGKSLKIFRDRLNLYYQLTC